MKKYLDMGSRIIIALTFILFIAALFTSGFTHALLLEAGVLLVSVKLIIMSYKNSTTSKELIKKLDEIKESIDNQKIS